MKPLNYDNSPCSPTSSNCVIWQGPDLHIIKLCKGDTISDVIASLATELAIVMDQLSITNYDLSCFDLVGCKPETYQELLQFLIEQICSLQGLSSTGVDTTGKSDDILITVAPCFIVNGVTVMTLIDYVTAIGLKICDIIDQIAIINNTLNELDIRVTILENTPPPTFTLPTVASDCILQNSPQIGGLGSPAVPMDQLLSILINDDDYGYCTLLDSIGLPGSLIDAVLSQCILNTDIQLSTGTTYSANPNWNSNWQTTENNLAASLSNVWVVLCDIYNYLDNQIGLTITETDCALGIANDADVYGFIDVTSGPYAGTGLIAAQNKQIVCSALYQWWVNYGAANPSYTGNIYIYESNTETYLSHPNLIKLGTSFQTFLNPLDGTTIGAVTPPGYSPGWAGPTAILFVAFVNEVDPAISGYHGQNNPPSLFTPAQPTSTYTGDYNTFVTDYTTYWTSFNAVIYPAYDANNNANNFLLHAYAATNNTDITLSGLSGALQGNYTILTFGSVTPTGPGSNPYITANQGLWNFGWGSILDKAVDSITGLLTFTTVEFENDLNSVLSGGSANCSSESLIQSWDPITQSLVLRQITSCSLDLSVTSQGCLSIEATSIDTYDSNTVNLTLDSNNFLTANVQDTDWHNLEGFDFYTANPALLTKRPMVRRIGNVLHFRGTVTIPLDSFTSPGTVVEYDYRSGVNTYEGLVSIASPAHSNLPYSGIGGINFLAGGSIQFYKGASVIPTTVLPTGYVIDSIYSLGWRMGWRTMDTGSCNTILTTMCNLAISPGGQLTWGVLVDLEESFVSGCNPGAWSTSAMNYVISNVTEGEHVTDFKFAVNVHDSALTSNQNAQPFFKTAEQYPITINANDAQEIGGFQTILDGLMAYISPCGTLIPTPTPCAIP
jgi:hypothetical protein